MQGGNTNPGGQSGVSTAPPAQHRGVGRVVVVDDVATPRSSAAKGVSTALGSEAETCGGTKRQAVLHEGKLYHESAWDEIPMMTRCQTTELNSGRGCSHQRKRLLQECSSGCLNDVPQNWSEDGSLWNRGLN